MKSLLLRKKPDYIHVKATIKLLKKDDLKAILELQDYVYKKLPKKVVLAKISEQAVSKYLGGSGMAYGVFHNNDLVAYAISHFPKNHPNNLGLDIGLPEKELNRVVHLELQIVHPDFRGNGLQIILNKMMIEKAKKKNFAHILATVSPENKISHLNLEKLGLRIMTTKQKYGHGERYIMYMKI
jgi:predicted GNAT superfamily acetyltransferase